MPMVMSSSQAVRVRDDVATLMRRYRHARGLTQEALAERAGVSVGAISYLERGLTRSPHRDTLRALADALSLSEQEAAALEQAARRTSRGADRGAERKVSIFTFSDSLPPEPLTSLIGRERDSAEITTLLAGQDVRLLTLTGPAGVGKTRLAIHVATRLQQEQGHTVAFVGLTAVQDPERVLAAIAQALEVQDTGILPLPDTLRIALADRDLLLVLDNFEQVATAARAIVDLLESCPGVTALVTGRVALNVRGEREFPVPPLALPGRPRSTELADIEQYAAVALFLERVRAVRPDFALDAPGDVKRMAEICAQLDGLPLAIELAAVQIRHCSLAELHRRLTGAVPLDALAGGAQDLPDHQRTMRSAIAWSYGLLSPDEQRVFRALSVFVGGATIDGVAAVTGLDQKTILEHLDTLVDQSVVYVTCYGNSTRYAQLVTLRAYGLECLSESPDELASARRRHAEYYAALAEGKRPQIDRCDPGAMELLAAEYENIRAALSWALEAADAASIWIGLQLAGALWFWWEVRGLLVEGLHWLERLVVVAPDAEDDGTRKVLVWVWSGIMANSFHLGRFERAYEAGEYALTLQRGLGDKELLAGALNNQGIVAAGMRRHETADAYYRESLELYEELGHPAEECKPLLNLGGLKRDLRCYGEALALYRASLRIVERADEHHEARAILWDDIGDIYILLGEPAKALAALRRAEEIFQRLDASLGLALCAHDRGRTLIGQGRLEEAAREFLRAIVMREELGDGAGAASSRIHLARVRLAQTDLREAERLLAEALRTLANLKRTEALWAVVEGGAVLACARGQYEEAARLYAAVIPRRDALWDVIDPQEYDRRSHDLETIRTALGEQTYATEFTAGAVSPLDEALDVVHFSVLDGGK
jgi:predicted ATPase/DNA-binding XRE family transcriptional regulator